jgi:hypothetical protein
MVIGDLGQGSAPERAYNFAREILEALMAGNRTAPALADFSPALTDDLFGEINDLEPRSYRLGGGRIEVDGYVSFLVRFVGREESLAGELFIRQAAAGLEDRASPPAESDHESAELRSEDLPTGWLLDDLILEERRALTEIRDSYRYDFSPYERFF